MRVSQRQMRTLFLYTKNLNMTFYNCQKSYVYYIEFISQIGDESHSYLQLNSKDASLFAFKKTIFDINSDVKKDFNLEQKHNEYLKIIDIFINSYNTCLLNIIDNYEITDLLNHYCIDLSKIFQKLSKLYNDSSEFEKLYLKYSVKVIGRYEILSVKSDIIKLNDFVTTQKYLNLLYL